MIVQPDFVDHFKTKALVKLTHDAAAPLAVLRLWGHCQLSRRWKFPNMTPEQLGELCGWGARKPACHAALIKAGFLKRLPEGGFEAHQWDEQNASLIQKWTAGAKSKGRPKKGAENNRTETDRLSPDNRPKTDQIRSDRIRVKSLQANRGGGVGTGGGDANGDVGTTKSAVLVPTFGALDKGLFRHELEAMASQCRQKLEAIKGDHESVVRSDALTEKAREDVEWYEEQIGKADESGDMEKLTRLRQELGDYVKQPSSYKADGFRPELRPVLKAWRDRIQEIERAMMGVKP